MDITSTFKLACKALPIGVMVKRPATALLEAMNALPFFDLAMDTGLAAPIPNTSIQLLSTGSDMQRSQIMDKLLQLEISWHLGATLCDTVYTALYYHHPEAVADFSLRAYILAYVKSIELVYNELAKGHIVDGEDVWLDHHGVSIGLADSVEQIDEMLDSAIRTTASLEVRQRLVLRRAMLQMFDNPSESTSLPFAYSQAGSEACPGFLSVTPYIRQSMPVPPSTLSDPVQYIPRLDSQMKHIGGLSTMADWQAYLRTASLVPYARSVAAGRIANVDNAYCQLAGTAQSAGIWRSIADGCAIATVRIPLHNRARQRRSYLSIAHSWNERGTAAFSVNNIQAFRICQTFRLDCLLEASLAAFDLALYHPSEYKQTMWWINRLTTIRCSLGVNRWAEVWMRISSGMLKKLHRVPLASAASSLSPASKVRFLLRHKWARKTPYPKPGRGLIPRWEEWERSEISLRERKIDDGNLDLALADELLAGSTFSHLGELRKDVQGNLSRSGVWKRGSWLYVPS